MFYRTCSRRCCCRCRRCPCSTCGDQTPIQPRSTGGQSCGCGDMAMTIVNGTTGGNNGNTGCGCSYTCTCSCR